MRRFHGRSIRKQNHCGCFPQWPCSFLPASFTAKEKKKNPRDEFCQETGLVRSRSVLANTSFARNKWWRVICKVWPCHSGVSYWHARVCVCVLYICFSVWNVWWTEKNTVNRNERGKKYISNAILSDDALVHLDEKPLFHNYAILQFLFPLLHLSSPSPSQIFLCTRTIIPHPWFKVSMLQWFFS